MLDFIIGTVLILTSLIVARFTVNSQKEDELNIMRDMIIRKGMIGAAILLWLGFEFIRQAWKN